MNRRRKQETKPLSWLAPLLALFTIFSGTGANAQGNDALLVRVSSSASMDTIARDYHLTVLDKVSGRPVYEVAPSDPDDLNKIQAKLAADSRIVYCEIDSSIALPEIIAGPFHLAFDVSKNSVAYNNQPAYQQVNMSTAPNVHAQSMLNSANTFDSVLSPVIVAVLDTGVSTANIELAARVIRGFNTLDVEALPRDIPDGLDNSAVGHGTMIAGLIARVAPNAQIMPIRVLNSNGVGTLMHVLQGLHYAVVHNVGVINMSFGTPMYSQALEDGIEEARDAQIVLVASAGNESSGDPHYPAALPEVVGVGSVSANNTLSAFSNYGVNVTVVAPGERIRSTFWNGNFATWSGTSFAAPFVSGEAALLVARYPGWTQKNVVQYIQQTSQNIDVLNPGFETQLGSGIVDIGKALWNQDRSFRR